MTRQENAGAGGMRRAILDFYLFSSPFYSLRALLWNVKTLGIVWWARCLVQNFCLNLSDSLKGRQVLAPQTRAVQLAPRSFR